METMIEKIENDFTHSFWTRQDEMVEDAEKLGYLVADVNCEYMVLIDEHSEDEKEYALYLGHANSTMWVERILMVD